MTELELGLLSTVPRVGSPQVAGVKVKVKYVKRRPTEDAVRAGVPHTQGAATAIPPGAVG